MNHRLTSLLSTRRAYRPPLARVDPEDYLQYGITTAIPMNAGSRSVIPATTLKPGSLIGFWKSTYVPKADSPCAWPTVEPHSSSALT